MPFQSEVTVVEHPVSVGAAWVSPLGTRYSILVLKLIDQPKPKFFVGNEFVCDIVDPERFGPVPTDAKAMFEYARRFIANEQEKVPA